MREILFRAKAKHSKEWVYGDYLTCSTTDGKTRHYIKRAEDGILSPTTIIPETLGQYTGLTDKNGNKVFEGDILDCISSNFDGSPRFVCSAILDITDYNQMGFLDIGCNEIEAIGNVHDNPELLGGK